MLRTPPGATIAAMMKATGWQQYSVRGLLSAISWVLGTTNTVQLRNGAGRARLDYARRNRNGYVNLQLTIIVGSYVSGVIQSLSCVRGVTIIVVTHMAALIWARSTQAWAMRFS